MTIMRWRNYPSLSDVFESLFDRQAENMENETYHISPAINILEHEKGFVIELAAPGFSKEDLKISLDSNVLTISAEGKKIRKKCNTFAVSLLAENSPNRSLYQKALI